MPVAEMFRNAGEDVSFSVYGTGSASFIQSRGYRHLPDDDPTVPCEDLVVRPGNVFYNLDHYYASAGLLDESFVHAWIQHRIRMLEKWNADLVVADMSPQTVIAARYLGIPVLSITQSCFYPDGDGMYFWGQPPRNTPKVTPVVNKILKRLGLPVVSRMEQLNVGRLNFIPGIPELDPVYSNSVRYVGPIEYPAVEEAGHPVPGEPYILVYPGRLEDTSGPSGLQLLEFVVQAYRNTKDTVVIACSQTLPAALRARMSGNMTVIPHFGPGLLARSRLFIHHGGHGSCMSALRRGVPSLIIPTHTEREFNARKVHGLGAGEYVLPGTLTAAQLYQLGEYVMEDRYREHAEEIAALIHNRNYGGAGEIYTCGSTLMKRLTMSREEL
nr:nucleotide disphospho-sugar-binding domain-containing protein [Paenibacillus lutrae]